MELSQLRYFKELAKSGNLTKTASSLYISPPSLSLAISRLENELQTPLFDRVKGRLHLNDRGKILLDAVESGVSIIDDAANTVRSLGASHENRVSIATTNQTLWNGLFADFMIEHPEIYLAHRNYPLSQFAYDNLLIQYDFILTRHGGIKNDNLLHTSVFSGNELMVAVPAGHRLSGRGSVQLKELAEEPFIFPPKGYGLHNFYLQICHEAGFEPNIVSDCGYLMMAYLHGRGIGLFFTSRRGSPYDAYCNGSFLRVEGVAASQEYLSQELYYDCRRKLGKAACMFRDFALSYYKD